MKSVIIGIVFAAFGSVSIMFAPVMALEGSGADWGARNPMGCPSLRQIAPPTSVQVVALLRCTHEVATDGGGELWLMENVALQIGAPVPYTDMYRRYTLSDADVNAEAYPLRGSYTWAICMTKRDAGLFGADPTLNCREEDVSDAQGVCWLTSFSDWRCRFTGYVTQTRASTAPPQF